MVLLELELHHQYYGAECISEVEIRLSKKTASIFSRYKLSLRKVGGVCFIYYAGRETVVDLVESLAGLVEGGELEFGLYCNENEFYVVSDLPVDWCGVVEFKNKLFDQKKSNIEVKDITFELKSRSGSKDAEIGRIVLDLSVLKQDLLKGVNRYRLGIQARKTQWVYYIKCKRGGGPHRLKVKNSDGLIFSQNPEGEIIDGHEYQVFDSGVNLFPLSRNMRREFSLITEEGNDLGAGVRREKVVISGLPVPAVDRFDVKVVDGRKQACSKMYVYI